MINKMKLTAAAVILAVGFFILNAYIYEEKQEAAATDYKDVAYVIQGERIKLEGGVAEREAALGASAKIVTRYFGNELKTDLNEDGREDVVFLLTQETGGSGTFFYVVAALNTEQGYVGSEGLLLGDRIAPQATEISQNPNHKNVIVVNYAERAPSEPFSTPPSIGKSVYLKLDPASRQWGEVAVNFSGEAEPARMTLERKTWTWVGAQYNDGREIKPKQEGRFTLIMEVNGRFAAMTDCNSMGGNYITQAGQITFSEIISTKMYCEGSQESEFAALLMNAESYHFTPWGELVLGLKFDSGTATFR